MWLAAQESWLDERRNIMPENNNPVRFMQKTQEWVTIQEAVEIASDHFDMKISCSDILRNVLYGNVFISIYFQSPVILRKVKTTNYKVKLTPLTGSLIHRLCNLDSVSFINNERFKVSTEHEYIRSKERVIDTPLLGYEYVIIQSLLAQSLKLPLPIKGAHDNNYGISVCYKGDIFQIFENITLHDRIKQQIERLPKDITPIFSEHDPYVDVDEQSSKKIFPIYILPKDAFFVIRNEEFDKLLNLIVKNKIPPSSSTRISTPLSRLLWLACRHNETISPLVKQPYKLLSIFEQWASADGITDRLSGDTLKTALERGSPLYTPASKQK